MPKYRIALLPGDGIGNDVMKAAKIVLDKIKLDAEYIEAEIGWEFWKKEGNPLPDRTVRLLKNTDCALFGAITSKPKEEASKELSPGLKEKGHIYYSPIVRLRQEFELHTNLRPCKAYKGNSLNYRDDIDIVIFRENTEGLYSGVEFYPVPENLRKVINHHRKMKKFEKTLNTDMSISLRIFTKKGCQRILKSAFDYARQQKKKSITVVEKPNVIRETSGMMIREARKMNTKYPEINLIETNVDAMAMWLVKNPQRFDVLVSSNMFGDIISDLAAQLIGGLGFAYSANIGDDYALFEPTHGSAPKYTGMYRVNPIAMILATRLMMEWLGENEKAAKLENAVSQVIAEAKIKTYDMGGKNSTLDIANAIADKIAN